MHPLAKVVRFLGDSLPGFIAGAPISFIAGTIKGFGSAAAGKERSPKDKGVGYFTGRGLGSLFNKTTKRFRRSKGTETMDEVMDHFTKMAEETNKANTAGAAASAAQEATEQAAEKTAEKAAASAETVSNLPARLEGKSKYFNKEATQGAAQGAAQEAEQVYEKFSDMTGTEAGIALALGGLVALAHANDLANTITKSRAEKSTPQGKMQRLSYSGNTYRDNLGADGQLALALHYNRHG